MYAEFYRHSVLEVTPDTDSAVKSLLDLRHAASNKVQEPLFWS